MSNVPESYKSEDEIGQDLSLSTLQGSGEDVVRIYRRYPWTHTAKINRCQDTALHVAADCGQQETVKQLLDAILKPSKGRQQIDLEINEEEEEIGLKALESKNNVGDTPLHLAASRGFANSCYWMAKANKKLLDIRNNKGETPLFLAAFNWQKDAFLLLYFGLCDKGGDVQSHFRRKNGDTILHCAIGREYFELAIILTNLKKEALVSCVNKKGMTCLDILATKPSAFKSSSNLGWWKQILYYLIHVPKLENQIENWKKEIKRKYPDTEIELQKEKEKNKKCSNITSIWRKVVALFGCSGDKQAKADIENPEILEENKHQKEKTERSKKNQHQKVQRHYNTIYECVKNACTDALQNIGQEFIRTKKMKEKHVWAAQILDQLSEYFTINDGKQPFRKDAWEESQLKDLNPTNQEGNNQETQNEFKDVDTAFLTAGKHGIVEIVDKILEVSPISLNDITSKGQKNILLVAVENRQPKIVKRLKHEKLWSNLLLGKDTKDNTILHLAAKASPYKPWRIPGSAMQMLWDIKWYQYVKGLVPHYMSFHINNEKKTPTEVFKEAHVKLVDDSTDWLKDTSNSCSVVAALIAGVSFAASSSVPGGTNDQGKAPLEGHPAFALFTISSLASLCFSITALIMFLSILTSRKQAKDFRKDLPIKLLLGLSSLFLAIASTLVTFCSANFFVLENKFKNILFPIYAATCLPISFYAIAQFPLYMDLVVAIFTKTPRCNGWKDDI